MKHVPSGLHAAPGITSMAVLLLVGQAVVAADFDGDGRDDLLLRNLHSDAWRYVTLVDDVPVEHALGLETEPVWRYVATGDFDGNGYSDILLRRHDTGEAAWHAVTSRGVQVRPLRLPVDPVYDVLGAGDLDGDGADEILLRRNRGHGAWHYYDVDGSRLTARRGFGATQNLDFAFAAIGDLDGDGTEDILARHTVRGHWIAYLMRGPRGATLRRPRMTQNLPFELQGLADITGDGKADPLLRNASTGEWIYYATGNRVGGGRAIAMRLHRGLGMTRNDRWTLAAIGDFDGDGRATPVVRNWLHGGWLLYDVEGAASDVVRFPGLSTRRVWVAAGRLTQDNPPALSRIEFLQGPPTYRKDYRTGEVTGPVNASRAESGEALEPWLRITRTDDVQVPLWFAENGGFVTSVWQRRTVVAVEATHAYRAPAPTLTAELVPADGDAIPLEVLLDVTERDIRTGYRTELVFDIPAEHHLPGGTVVVRADGDGTAIKDRLPLFGETVEMLSLTWIPVTVGDYAPTDLATDDYIHRVVEHLPIGAYRTKIGPPLTYRPTGKEANGVLDSRAMWDQVRVHQAAHACGHADLYFGLYPQAEAREDDVNMGVGGRGGGSVAIGPTYVGGPNGWDAPPWNGMLGTYAHEVGHMLRLLHAPCGDPSYLDLEYPYPNGALGPARGWHPWFNEFVGRDSDYSDLMGYCDPSTLSDYHYQKALMFLQAPHYAEWKLEADACWEEEGEEEGVTVRSLAIVGRVAPDGTATIVGTAHSPRPPTAAGDGAGRDGWSLSVLDAGGGVLYRVPLTLESDHVHHHGPPPGRVWQVRIPPVDDAGEALLVVRGAGGAVRVQEPLRVAR